MRQMAEQAKRASKTLGTLSTAQKDAILLAVADALKSNVDDILRENALDIEAARAQGRTQALLDRLALDEKRIAGMANGLRQVAMLPDPVGEIVDGSKRPNGLRIVKQRVPLGVVGIIYEARPNVTADAIGLCIKTGNAVILKGGSEALRSNIAIVQVARRAAYAAGMPQGAIQLVEDTSRAAANALMRMNGLVDVLIPRGGAGLIRAVVENSTVPVIETGVGNCHVFVDASADLDMAVSIAVNAKASRPAVCNAAETLLVHEQIADALLPRMFAALREAGVELRGCSRCCAYEGVRPATDEDYATEYLDYILAVKVVSDVHAAIAHIDAYGTGHSECIVTQSLKNARLFQQTVDAAVVYVNASTRFTDGGEFGMGAEIGISTQKLHARGPMGLTELTTVKYLVEGDGQVR